MPDDQSDLEARHRAAEALISSFRYKKPDAAISTKGHIKLGRGEHIRGSVQVVKKHGGENNLHYHTHAETLWWVIRGKVRFYGPEDVVLGAFGPGEGIVTPRYSRYWFENCGDEDLELLQVAASPEPGLKSGRTDVTTQRYQVGTGLHFDATAQTDAAE
jgi:mannose-6-phosphate isomerase-like protein (cupin superfamily)